MKAVLRAKLNSCVALRDIPKFSKNTTPNCIPFQRRRQIYIAVLRRTAFASLIPTLSLDEPTLNELFLVKFRPWAFQKIHEATALNLKLCQYHPPTPVSATLCETTPL